MSKTKEGKELSNCCGASVKVVGDETMHWECTKCERACDIQPEKTVGRWVKPFRRLWEISFKNAPTRIKRKDGTTVGVELHEVDAKLKVMMFIRRLLAEKEREKEEMKKELIQKLVDDYGDFRPIKKYGLGLVKYGRTLRFFLLPHTQHKEGDDDTQF